jgi:hypothetical protein
LLLPAKRFEAAFFAAAAGPDLLEYRPPVSPTDVFVTTKYRVMFIFIISYKKMDRRFYVVNNTTWYINTPRS